jgi:hypothetical protein
MMVDGIKFRKPIVKYLHLADKHFHRVDDEFEIDAAVVQVQLVQIDSFDAEPSQARFERAYNMLPRMPISFDPFTYPDR